MSGGSQNTVSQQTVPSWLQPALMSNISEGQQLNAGGGPQYYPGQQVASLTPLQTAGISQVGQLAQGPNASSTAQNQNMNIESGAYLNPSTNPYLAGTLTTAEQGVQNPIESEFGSAGRNVVGSAPVQSSAMNQLANEIYGGAYQSGMSNMVNSQYASPSLDAGTYMPAQQELQTGAGVQQQNQNQIQALMNQYNYQQQLPENMLSWLSGITSGNGSPFSAGSSSTSGTNNPWLTGLGGATALGGLANESGLLGYLGSLGGGVGSLFAGGSTAGLGYDALLAAGGGVP
jgi:hypothetical protein